MFIEYFTQNSPQSIFVEVNDHEKSPDSSIPVFLPRTHAANVCSPAIRFEHKSEMPELPRRSQRRRDAQLLRSDDVRTGNAAGSGLDQ